jgi:hypothetical protein
MEQNPYAPPQAPVAEAEPARPAVKPSQVVLAVRLLWGMLALGLMNSAVQWPKLVEATPAEMIVAIQLVTFAIVGWLTIKISSGRNWARITYLVLFLIGLPGFFLQMPAVLAYSMLAAVLSFVQLAAQGLALVLVFRKPGSDWYRRGLPRP